jgi:flagella basal body P-ring formation protein FlgA
MINKIFIAIFFIIAAKLSIACEVHLPHRLVILGQTSDFSQIIQHTGCNENMIQNLSSTLASVSGKITSLQFTEILKSQNDNVTIRPGVVEVQHIKDLVREQLKLPPGVLPRSFNAFNSPNYIALAPDERVDIECLNCLFGLQQPLNINITSLGGTVRALTLKADFKKMVRAYRVISFHPAFSEIAETSLKEEYIESIPHTDLVTNLETLKFFKINKPLKAGDFLRQSDLNALSLVKAGLKTEVIIENELLKLKTSGISRSNGILGEFVEVFQPQMKKKYFGKVIDINKVLVEL